ncbi:hypothetical protein B296_00059216 [Ensete ventricosum]|uniref:Uncharacterized protein n=1 Tax=Ensete ventricosum TaxID=4639 RepID=A0A426XIQ5_ENSVE|nr:hypothetical protein B296_00059216 [Ensete ventricosum]
MVQCMRTERYILAWYEDRDEEVTASRGSPHPWCRPEILRPQTSPTAELAASPLEASTVLGSPSFSCFFFPRSSQAATTLILPGSGRQWSKSTVTDLYRVVTVEILIVIARNSPVSDGTWLKPRYRLVVDGPRIGLLADRYILFVLDSMIRNYIPW